MTDTTAPLAAEPGDAPGPYGLPAALFARLWTLDDVCAFACVERTKARELLASDGAPPRMRMGSRRCDRWNPVLLVAWLHGDDWAALAVPRPVAPAAPADGASGPRPVGPARGAPPGRPWPAGASGRAPR